MKFMISQDILVLCMGLTRGRLTILQTHAQVCYMPFVLQRETPSENLNWAMWTT
jgi:hypothetical protein